MQRRPSFDAIEGRVQQALGRLVYFPRGQEDRLSISKIFFLRSHGARLP
jgi:hypothetical protein